MGKLGKQVLPLGGLRSRHVPRQLSRGGGGVMAQVWFQGKKRLTTIEEL